MDPRETSGHRFLCVGAEGLRGPVERNLAYEPGVTFSDVFQKRVDAGVPTRLEAILDLAGLEESFSSEGLRDARFFVRVWQNGSADSLIAPAGSRYVPPMVTAPADRAWTLANDNATAVLAGMAVAGGAAAVAKNQRWKDWQLPLPWPLLWFFSRLHRSQLLDHRKRRLVHDLVEANPGIRFSDLRKRSGLATGVLTHHLRMLEQHELVVTVRSGRQRLLYSKQSPRRADGHGLTERQQQILGLLGSGGATQAQVAEKLGISQQAVSYHLQKLRHGGRVGL